jgi:HSP20 family molecular chaperone IbpA
MATRYSQWSVEMASPPIGRRRGLFRLTSRERQVLVPSRMAFEPPADVYETEDAVIVRLEIAGLRGNSGEISVEIREDLLTISGERLDPASGSARRYEQMEIQTGSFQRTVHLPCPVDETAAVARYEDGFLTVRLPKVATPRRGTLIVAIE